MGHPSSLYRIALCLCGVGLSQPALSAEVQFEGFYRARGRAFTSLSIDPDLPSSVAPMGWIQHRAYLAPRFLISDKASVHMEFRGLDGLAWGSLPVAEPDTSAFPTNDLRTLDIAFTDDLRGGNFSETDGRPGTGANFELWRAYAEIKGNLGTFRFGRMPIHWGLGVWQNDGSGLSADFGDSADRVQWERPFGDVFLRGALEVDAYGLSDRDARDIYGGTFAVAYRDEKLDIGANVQLKRASGGRTATGADQEPFTVVTASAAMEYETGPLHVGAEFVGRFGSGQLGEVPQATVTSAGGVIAADLEIGKPTLSADLGFATGDGDYTDSTFSTFAFDRDYNIGILLFEQPAPIVQGPNGPDLSQTLMGNGISNALFGRAGVEYPLPEDITATANVAIAQTFALPDGLSDQSFIGTEVNAGARWSPEDNISVSAAAAFMLPGGRFTSYNDGAEYPDGFDGFVFGGQLLGRVDF